MSTPGRRAPLARWLPLGIFALGLAVRLVYLAQDAASPWFHYRFVDANDYHKLGVAFAAGHWPADEAFFRPPLYPLLLGVVYRLFGDGIVVVKMLQALVGSATCVLVFWLGRAAFRDRAVGLIAAVITCLCAPLVFYDGQALSANLDVFLFTATALVLIAAQRRDRLRWWAAAGVLIGLGATNRGAMVLIAPAVAAWLLLVYRRARAEHAPRWWAAAVVLVVGTLLPIAPVAWHNLRLRRAAAGQGR